MTDTRKSSAEIEREVEARRAGLRGTLDQLSDRMTPGQVLDETWQFVRRSGGGHYVRNLGSSMRDNPLPVALVGAGIAWLMSGRSGKVPTVPRPGFLRSDLARPDFPGDDVDMYESDYPNARRLYPDRDFARGSSTDGADGDGMAQGLLDKARSAVDGARDAASSATSSVASSASSVAESLSETAGRAVDGLGRAKNYAGERASAFGRDASVRGRRFGSRAWQTGSDAQERALGFAKEQPLALALAGLAFGAALGAAFRSTSAEARLMGEASDRVKEQALSMAEEGIDQAASVAERTFDAVKDEAKEQGLTTADAANVAESVTERVRKVAEKGKAKFKEEIAASGSSPVTPDNSLL